MTRRETHRAGIGLAVFAVAGTLLCLTAVALAAVALTAVAVTAADPTAAPVIAAGDPRSDGAGPGLVGSPLLIMVGVVLLGLATAAVTFAIARLTQRD